MRKNNEKRPENESHLNNRNVNQKKCFYLSYQLPYQRNKYENIH